MEEKINYKKLRHSIVYNKTTVLLLDRDGGEIIIWGSEKPNTMLDHDCYPDWAYQIIWKQECAISYENIKSDVTSALTIHCSGIDTSPRRK